MNYPPESEYEYLTWSIGEQYWQEKEAIVDPLWCVWDRLSLSNAPAESLAKADVNFLNAQIQVSENRRRREDIVYWLYLDTGCRESGKTYPDIMEGNNRHASS